MWYAKARYYNSDLGRFAAEDPIKGNILDIQSLNLYPYVKNNPLKYIDPDGRKPVLIEAEVEDWTGCRVEDLEGNEGTGKVPEYDENAGQIIIDNVQYIKEAADYFNVDQNIVAGVIYAEQSLNVDFKDSLTDWLGFYGVDTSIGIGQVRMSTAKLLEDKGYIPKTKATEGGWDIPIIGFVSGTENMAREKRLEDNRTNVYYVAAYIKLIQDTWEDEFESISDRPDIIGTLYNIGHDYSEPHSSPSANPFGEYVSENYDTMQYLLNQK